MTEAAATAATLARAYAELTAGKRVMEKALKERNAQLAGIETDLIDKLIEEGIAKVSVETASDGVWTISANTLAWAKVKPEHITEMPAILEGMAMADLLTINSTKLSGMYREHVEAKDHGGSGTLPQEFVDLLEVNERTKVSARRV